MLRAAETSQRALDGDASATLSMTRVSSVLTPYRPAGYGASGRENRPQDCALSL